MRGLAVFALAAFLTAFSGAGLAHTGHGGLPAATSGRVVPIDVRTLLPLLVRKEKGFLLINVHVPYAGEIPGTDLFLPYDRVAELAAKLPKDKDSPLVVYCRSGAMSRVATATLVRLGYTRVYDLTGGMNAWQAAGLKLAYRSR